MVHRKGFALILVLLFTTIVLMAGSSMALALSSGVKLNRQSKNASEAYSMARSAISDGINELRSYQTDDTLVKPDPATSCTPTGKYNFSDDGSTHQPKILSSPPYSSGSAFYAYQLCANGINNYIMGVGFSGGQKITLKAKITHDDTYTRTYEYSEIDNSTFPPGTTIKTGTCGTDTGLSACDNTQSGYTVKSTIYNHTKDIIKIYQVGS